VTAERVAFVGGTVTEAELAAARLRAENIPVRIAYGSPWPPFVDPVWRGGFRVLVPASRLEDASELLADVRSTARPLLPRVLAILVLVAFVAPLIVQAVASLTRR
jgi:hypothetical protein